MTGRLEGTATLVTGASSGIGEATARSLAAQGSAVALVARRKERLDELAAEIEAAGGRAVPVPADVTDQAQASAAVDAAVEHFGRLDIVVNNAGVMLLGPVVDAPLEDWDRMVQVNLNGALYVAHAALPHLLRAAESEPRRVADLVNISSVAGRLARSGSAVYNLTKHGLGAFSEALRQEVTGRHVRVSLVEPGAVVTELVSHLSPAAIAGFEQRFGSLELLESSDIADVVEHVVTRTRRMAINEVLVRPTEQEG
jgi:NADP-dependent 3-hydroxy acid dehydrogenase YdfG